MQDIKVRGAREHNLKNVDVDMPRDRLVVITGLSGSGKSSLAFDTIYAEGQRRYVESLSAYARQFLELMQKPDVDSIEGLSPAISIEQKTTSRNPRSTVGTVTEIYDYLRLLFARVGVPYSPATGLPIESQTVSQMVDRVMAMPEGTRLYLLAPIVRGRKGEYRKELAGAAEEGLPARQDRRQDATRSTRRRRSTRSYKHDIDVVVDRIVVRDDLGNRLADSHRDGAQAGRRHRHRRERRHAASARSSRRKFACPVSGFTIAEIEPRLFSFNKPHGACPACDGLGIKLFFDPELVVPDDRLSLARRRDRAVGQFDARNTTCRRSRASRRHFKVKHDDAVARPAGEGARRHPVRHGRRRRSPCATTTASAPTRRREPFEGVIPNLERRWRETDCAWVREELGRYPARGACETCHGARLKPEALAVKIDGSTSRRSREFSIRDAR